MKKLLLVTFISLISPFVCATKNHNDSSLAIDLTHLSREQLIELVEKLKSQVKSQKKSQTFSGNQVLAGGSDSGGSGGGQFLKTQFLITADELIFNLIKGKIALVSGFEFPADKLFEFTHGRTFAKAIA